MDHYVFISHASEDATVAQAICNILEKNGVQCWIAPRDVPPAAEYGEAIVVAVEASKELILLLSAPANASQFVMREVSLALDAGISILPLRLFDVVPAKSLRFFLQGLQRFDAFPPPLEDRISKVIPTIRAAIKNDLVAQEDQPNEPERTGTAITQPIDEAERVVATLVRDEVERRGFGSAPITNNILIFSTRKQKMWLSFTTAGVLCVLDNRPKGGQIRVQWLEPLAVINDGTVAAVDRNGRPGLLRIGSRKNWLYTTALFGSGGRLRETILSEIQRARRVELVGLATASSGTAIPNASDSGESSQPIRSATDVGRVETPLHAWRTSACRPLHVQLEIGFSATERILVSLDKTCEASDRATWKMTFELQEGDPLATVVTLDAEIDPENHSQAEATVSAQSLDDAQQGQARIAACVAKDPTASDDDKREAAQQVIAVRQMP